MNIENTKYLEFAKEIAYEAGKIMLKYFSKNNAASYKANKKPLLL